MAKFTIVIEPVEATPKDYPTKQLNRLKKRLKRHLIKKTAPMLVKDMQATTQGWSTAPTMVFKYSEPFGTRLQIEVFPKGRGSLNWKRVSEGTGPRVILAKTSKGMSFQRDYTPHTTPKGRWGGPGRKSGQWLRGVRAVTHEIEPRKFTIHILKKREKKIRRDIQRVVHRVLK